MKSLVDLAVLVSALAPLHLSGQAPAPGPDAGRPAGLTEWQPSKLMPGVFYMSLLGEGTKPGVYVYRVRAPDGFRIPPHWHTQTMHLTVLSGTLHLGMGEALDSSQARPYAAGSFLVLPAGMRHLEWFEGDTVVHVETEGPIETVFVNPGNDPRNRAQP
jgi:quercetin dioxygenase-like cupin family protein